MSSAGINPLAIIAPDLFAKQLSVQRRQALAQSLLEQGGSDPGKAAYGGLRNAGNAILGAYLAKRADQDMANLYAPPSPQDQESQVLQQRYSMSPQQASGIMNTNVPQPQPNTGEPQISNNPGSGPTMVQGQVPQPAPQQPQQQAQAAPAQTQSPQRTIPQAMSGMIPTLPGMTPQQSILMYYQTPQAYFTALAAANAPTPEQKNVNAAFGAGTPAAQQALQGEIGKAGSIEVRPEGYIRLPNGQIVYGPNESSNVYYTTGPNNEPIAHTIQGGAEAAASTAGQIEAAKEQNKIIEVELSDGRKIPMRAGDAVRFGIIQPQQSASSQGSPSGASVAAQNPAIAAQVNSTRPAPITIGQSTVQKKVQEEAGDVAGVNATVDAQTEKLLNAIKGLRDLNNRVPDSTGIPADWKGDINKRVPALFKGDAGALSQWEQLNSIGILGGIQALGLGRLDIPIVKQVQAGGGISADLPAKARGEMLDNLEAEVRSNQAAAHQRGYNLNRPNAATPPRTPMTPYPTSRGGTSPQDIVNELRRRGVVK